MRDFNKVIILGNLTRDPELRFTPSGQPVASFAVATNRRWKDKSGNMQEAAEFHDVVAWGKLGEIANQILQKGQKALVEGRLQTRNWEGQDGVRRYKTEIIAENLSALGTARGRTSEDFEQNTVSSNSEDSKVSEKSEKIEEKKEPKKEKREAPASKGEEDQIDLDDIPF